MRRQRRRHGSGRSLRQRRRHRPGRSLGQRRRTARRQRRCHRNLDLSFRRSKRWGRSSRLTDKRSLRLLREIRRCVVLDAWKPLLWNTDRSQRRGCRRHRCYRLRLGRDNTPCRKFPLRLDCCRRGWRRIAQPAKVGTRLSGKFRHRQVNVASHRQETPAQIRISATGWGFLITEYHVSQLSDINYLIVQCRINGNAASTQKCHRYIDNASITCSPSGGSIRVKHCESTHFVGKKRIRRPDYGIVESARGGARSLHIVCQQIGQQVIFVHISCKGESHKRFALSLVDEASLRYFKRITIGDANASRRVSPR